MKTYKIAIILRIIIEHPVYSVSHPNRFPGNAHGESNCSRGVRRKDNLIGAVALIGGLVVQRSPRKVSILELHLQREPSVTQLLVVTIPRYQHQFDAFIHLQAI